MAVVCERLVRTESEDGYTLAGLLVTPAAGVASDVAVLVVPGLYAAFSDRPYPEIVRALAAHEVAALVGNTRGHDFGAVLRRADGSLLTGGGGWERLDDSALDIGGWVTFLAGQGYRRVVLFGHSLGARTAAIYQATYRDERVAALVLASPAVGPVPPPEPGIHALARRMVAEGRGHDLLPWPPVGASMSARTYLEHEEPAGRWLNVFVRNHPAAPDPPAAGLRCPVLAFFGADERRDGPRGRTDELDRLRRGLDPACALETALIPDAGHLYHDREERVAALVVGWLSGLTLA